MRDSGRGVVEQERLSKALEDFNRARAQASLQEITSRLRGKSADLLSFEEVARKLQVTGETAAGRRSIPLEAIVGSVGRYSDFTRTFLPRRSSDAQRWARVRAVRDLKALPPIDVYQIGDAYFVLDGNHRVSIARQLGATHIDAIVTVVQTRVAFSPQDDPDTLIVKAEHAGFLAATQLDELRPGADVHVSAAGQYAQLEKLIGVHRYFAEEAEQRQIDDGEAVTRWYDEAYLPVIKTIREQGILRYFPNRTETDLYVFITTHQAQLQEQMGWSVTAQVAAANLLQSSDAAREPWHVRARARIARLLRRAEPTMAPHGSWSGERVAARYAGQLFADILFAFAADPTDDQALAQVLLIAQREKSRLYGLGMAKGERSDHDAWRAAFEQKCRAAAIEGQLVIEDGSWIEAMTARAALADLVVAAAGPFVEQGGLEMLLTQSPRPIFFVPGQARPVQRALLYYQDDEASRQALFAAVYMAEQWQTSLHILLAGDSAGQRQVVEGYLAMHDVSASFEDVDKGWQTLAGAAERYDADCLLLGFAVRSARDRQQMAAFRQLLRACDRPLFVCT